CCRSGGGGDRRGTPSPRRTARRRWTDAPRASAGTSARARRRWPRSSRLAEEATDLDLGHRVEVEAALAQQPREALVPLGEPPGGAPQRALGVDAEQARDGDRREQHVADLLLGVGRSLELVDFLAERLERAVAAAPFEPAPGGSALHLGRAGEGRERLGHVLLEPVLALLLRLDPLPVHEDLVGPGDPYVPEHMRVPADQLRDDPARDVVDVPRAVVGGHLGVERDLEQQVAELLAKAIPVVGVDRVEDLVGLLEQMAGEGPVRLLAVPGASARAA